MAESSLGFPPGIRQVVYSGGDTRQAVQREVGLGREGSIRGVLSASLHWALGLSPAGTLGAGIGHMPQSCTPPGGDEAGVFRCQFPLVAG